MASSFIWAGMGRLLIGGSVAVAFVAMLKLAVHWFAPRQFALTSGLALFCPIIGAVFAGVPLRLLVSAVGWRPVMLTSGLVTLAVAGLIWILVRDDPGEKGYTSYAYSVSGVTQHPGFMTNIKEVFKHRNPWLLSFIPGGIVGSVLTLNVLAVLLLCAGFTSGCMIIGFAFVKESVPPSLAGTASGIYNMGVMLGPMILQPVVGLVLDLHWQGHKVDGIKQYSLNAYQLGFSLMLVWLVLGATLILFTIETRCEQME